MTTWPCAWNCEAASAKESFRHHQKSRGAVVPVVLMLKARDSCWSRCRRRASPWLLELVRELVLEPEPELVLVLVLSALVLPLFLLPLPFFFAGMRR